MIVPTYESSSHIHIVASTNLPVMIPCVEANSIKQFVNPLFLHICCAKLLINRNPPILIQIFNRTPQNTQTLFSSYTYTEDSKVPLKDP
jgi:hypothetical protein